MWDSYWLIYGPRTRGGSVEGAKISSLFLTAKKLHKISAQKKSYSKRNESFSVVLGAVSFHKTSMWDSYWLIYGPRTHGGFR
ncbi:hypothetical protein CEXT_763291 [Caerostris extrusa]|uniref:Uncharacterized protein n=1 Tax=Caerostris extrusa TaxID=172846 RepID=A0AAV4X678_CAEEX|nr:hypothetical protein CEXT_763291 [Caerostris extrusa]